MADAKIVDIKGIQWELKDEVARNNILNLQNKNEEINAKITDIEKTRFTNLSGRDVNATPSARWIKISGLYSGDFYNNNVFIITSRRGEIIQLICPLDDNNIIFTPVAIRFWNGINKFESIKFKDGDLYFHHAGWNSLRINQISGDKVEIKITKENPPGDAIDIKINEFQLKQ